MHKYKYHHTKISLIVNEFVTTIPVQMLQRERILITLAQANMQAWHTNKSMREMPAFAAMTAKNATLTHDKKCIHK